MMKIASKVAASIPPITAVPSIRLPTAPAPLAIADGTLPKMKANAFADQGWWSVYSDPFLSALIKDALENNYGFKTAIARARGGRVSWRGALRLFSHRERGIRSQTRSWPV